jgi:hypothetical protein
MPHAVADNVGECKSHIGSKRRNFGAPQALATLIDSVGVLAYAAFQPLGEALGEKDELLRIPDQDLWVAGRAVEKRVDFLVRIEYIKKLVLSQCDSQEGGWD